MNILEIKITNSTVYSLTAGNKALNLGFFVVVVDSYRRIKKGYTSTLTFVYLFCFLFQNSGAKLPNANSYYKLKHLLFFVSLITTPQILC